MIASMKKYSVAIIGGGFSGLCLASMLGGKLKDNLLVLEGNKRVGKKILATGNGQGNLTNKIITADFYHGDKNFAFEAISRYTNTHLLDYFDKLGLLTDSIGQKIYPASFTAGAILDVLRFEIDKQGVEVKTEHYVTNVRKKEHFVIECQNGEVFFADKVVFAFGGKSGAGFLTDGKSYSLAQNLGHTITSLSPSLVQLKTEKEKIRGLKGIKQEAKVSLYTNEHFVVSFAGDILFTDFGVSGNSIFSLSAYLKGLKNPSIKIEFLPTYLQEDLALKLRQKCTGGLTYEQLLVSVLPTRLSLAVLKDCLVNAQEQAKKQEIEQIVRSIKAFNLKIEGPCGFESSQVTAGGINTNEICVQTMQSKLVSGLYIIGEALNVDGDCGGYNLQWAFTSARIAKDSIVNG